MLPTTKEPTVGPVPEKEFPSNADGSGGSGSLPRRTDAVGAEVPVIVHASRYSSAAVGGGKKLPPVHEETRTVIVFPNGAVVRISAAMAAGELVVLTNKQTGTDVICRVVNVKAQPGIQNYVNLEFTQRAPGFWDASSPVASNVRQEPPQPVSKSLPAPAVPSELGSADLQTITPKSAPTASPARVTIDSSLAPAPLKLEKPRSPAVLSSSLMGSDSSLNQKPIGASTDTAQIKNWSAPSHAAARTSDGLSGSKKVLLIAGAAVLLLGIGAAGGAGLLRNYRTSRPAAQSAANSPDQSVPLPPVSPSPDSGLRPPQDVAADSSGLQSAGISDASVLSSTSAVQPAAAHSLIEQHNGRSSEQSNGQSSGQSVATPVPEQHSRIATEKLAAPVSRTPVIQDAVQAPPVVGAQISGLAASPTLGGSIAGEVPRVNAPAVPLRMGGQIQPAKSIASPAPSYPTAALSKRIEGVVTIDAELDNTGRIVSTEVISGPPELQLAALSALRKWKYQPAMLNGLAIGSHTIVSISFHLPSSLSGARPK